MLLGFVGRNFRHFFKKSSLSPDKVSPDKVPCTNKDIRNHACTQERGQLYTKKSIARNASIRIGIKSKI